MRLTVKEMPDRPRVRHVTRPVSVVDHYVAVTAICRKPLNRSRLATGRTSRTVLGKSRSRLERCCNSTEWGRFECWSIAKRSVIRLKNLNAFTRGSTDHLSQRTRQTTKSIQHSEKPKICHHVTANFNLWPRPLNLTYIVKRACHISRSKVI